MRRFGRFESVTMRQTAVQGSAREVAQTAGTVG